MKGYATKTGNRDDSLNLAVLRIENIQCRGVAGRSQENAHLGFLPAFQDLATGIVYRSCFGDGRVAPCHLLDGLPDPLVVKRNRQGRVVAVKSSVISGFLRAGLFYTREQAMSMAKRIDSDA